MNLREDKHWSYGACASIGGTKAQLPFIAYAPVQTDKTSESMTQIRNELDAAIGKRPVSEDELKFARDSLVLSLPGDNETASGLASRSEARRVGEESVGTCSSRRTAYTHSKKIDTIAVREKKR